MITDIELPNKGSGMPNHYAGDLLHTMAISGLSRVQTELFELTVVPALAPHPVQMRCNPGLTLFHCHQQLRMDVGFMALFEYT